MGKLENKEPPHVCNERCICIIHLTPLYYAPNIDEHACQDPKCEFAKGFHIEKLWDKRMD